MPEPPEHRQCVSQAAPEKRKGPRAAGRSWLVADPALGVRGATGRLHAHAAHAAHTADNAQAAIAHELLAEASRYGTTSVRRAYGDWTTGNLKGWKDVLHKLAIQPVQQFSSTTGKNATDSSLIIDAMDILHGGGLQGFCLVSSDSDFTRLATRIREAGLVVYGFGEKKTPQPFVAACDKFIYTEIPRPQPGATAAAEPAPELEELLTAAATAAARDDGWAPPSAVGSLVAKNSPSFDPRNFGYQKLGELVRRQPYLEVKEVAVGDTAPNVHLYVRLREAGGRACTPPDAFPHRQ